MNKPPVYARRHTSSALALSVLALARLNPPAPSDANGSDTEEPRPAPADISRSHAHIIPLVGTRRVKDFTQADAVQLMREIMAGKSRRIQKTQKLRGKSIIRGGAGTAARRLGLLGGIFSYAIEFGVIEHNPAHDLKRPKDNVRQRRLSQCEYRLLGEMLREANKDCTCETAVAVIRLLAMTGCRRSEVIGLFVVRD